MKPEDITIQWRPEFRLAIDFDTILALSTVAARHYDGACVEAAQPTGLLGRWAALQVHDFAARATARELDLTSKICEMRHTVHVAGLITDAQLVLLNEYVHAVRAAFQNADTRRNFNG